MMGLSVGRQIGLNIPAGDDFASWCMAAMAFLGLAHTFKSGEMIRVGLLIDRLDGPHRRWSSRSSRSCSALGFIGFFAWHAVALDLRFLALQRHVAGRAGGAAVDPAARLSRRARHPVHRRSSTSSSTSLRGDTPRYEKAPPTTAEEVVERAVAERGLSAPWTSSRSPSCCSLLLAVLLAGGVWIAIACSPAAGSACSSPAAASRPAPCSPQRSGATRASWELAALPLFIWMGEILFRTRLSEEMFRGLAPWLERHARAG